MELFKQFALVIILLAAMSILFELVGFASSGWLVVHRTSLSKENKIPDDVPDRPSELVADKGDDDGHIWETKDPNSRRLPFNNGGLAIPEHDAEASGPTIPPGSPGVITSPNNTDDRVGHGESSSPFAKNPSKLLPVRRPIIPIPAKPNKMIPVDNGGVPIPDEKDFVKLRPVRPKLRAPGLLIEKPDKNMNTKDKASKADTPKSDGPFSFLPGGSVKPATKHPIQGDNGAGRRILTFRPPLSTSHPVNSLLKSIIKSKNMFKVASSTEKPVQAEKTIIARNMKKINTSSTQGFLKSDTPDDMTTESRVKSFFGKTFSTLSIGLWAAQECADGNKNCSWTTISDGFLLIQAFLKRSTAVGGMATWNDLRVETIFGLFSGVVGFLGTLLTVKPFCMNGRLRLTAAVGICGMALSGVLFLVSVIRVVSFKSSLQVSLKNENYAVFDVQMPWAAAVSGIGACLAFVTAGFLAFFTWVDDKKKWSKFYDNSAVVFKVENQSSVVEKTVTESNSRSDGTYDNPVHDA